MKKNMGNIDKVVRTVVAVVAILLLATGNVAISSVLGIILAAVAAIFLLTSIVGVCPLYSIVGLSTCPVKE